MTDMDPGRQPDTRQPVPPPLPPPLPSERAAPAAPQSPVIVVQRIRGPGLLRHTLNLITRPESWAQAAQYPLISTLASIILVALVSGAVLAGVTGWRIDNRLRDFATHYATRHPPMMLSDGKLSVVGKSPLSAKIVGGSKALRVGVVIDPTGHTPLHHIKTSIAILVNATAARRRVVNWRQSTPLLTIQRALDKVMGKSATGKVPAPIAINGSTVGRLIHAPIVSAWMFMYLAVFGVAKILGDLCWAIFIMFLVTPVVAIINRESAMPRAIARRIGAAVIVPLLALSTLLEALRISPEQILSRYDYFVQTGWWIAAMAMACWAAVIARKTFAPRRRTMGM